MLDGFDISIYVYVLVPAVSELLAASNIASTKSNVALYGGRLFAAFMLGWAASMFWGWLADRIGRIRVMCYTILWYSICTALCGFSTSITVFAVLRSLAGFGVGGEWAAGTTLLQESVPENMRVRLAGWLHTATPIGMLLGSLSSLLLPILGWRQLFVLGALPALLTVYLRLRIPESKRWEEISHQVGGGGASLFRRGKAWTTWTAALVVSVGILGLWSSTFWAPTMIFTELLQAGRHVVDAQRIVSLSGVLVNVGTLIACLLMPWLATHLGSRRRAASIFFIGAFASNILAYGLVVMVYGNVYAFVWVMPILGFFTNGIFSLFSIWLPEMFSTPQRAFGSAFTFSFGRLVGALGPALIGVLVGVSGSYPLAISIVSLVYVMGLAVLRLATETAGRPLSS